jgi:hypothetical protein
MKFSNNLLLILTVLVGFIFLSSCTQSRIAAKGRGNLKLPTVKLHVVGNPKELKIQTPGSSMCKAANPANGCIAVGRRDIAVIAFELKTSPDWYFTEFKVCRGDSKEGPNCDLEEWEQAEFFAADSINSELLFPDDGGIIDLTSLSNSLTKFYLVDFNSVEQDFFYTIKACNDKAIPKCITSDPDIENRGRN